MNQVLHIPVLLILSTFCVHNTHELSSRSDFLPATTMDSDMKDSLLFAITTAESNNLTGDTITQHIAMSMNMKYGGHWMALIAKKYLWDGHFESVSEHKAVLDYRWKVLIVFDVKCGNSVSQSYTEINDKTVDQDMMKTISDVITDANTKEINNQKKVELVARNLSKIYGGKWLMFVIRNAKKISNFSGYDESFDKIITNKIKFYDQDDSLWTIYNYSC